MKKLLILLLVSTAIQADLPFQPRFTWTAPTEFTDNQPLDAATDLQEYQLTCNHGIQINGISPTATTYLANAGQFAAGDYTCSMVSVLSAVNGGWPSAISNPVTFTVNQSVPKPIVDFGAN